VHVTGLAAALLELAASPHAGACHVAGADAVSRYELGLLIAARDGLNCPVSGIMPGGARETPAAQRVSGIMSIPESGGLQGASTEANRVTPVWLGV
jgi:dTDP-4-dehydrorhamnose reductase